MPCAQLHLFALPQYESPYARSTLMRNPMQALDILSRKRAADRRKQVARFSVRLVCTLLITVTLFDLLNQEGVLARIYFFLGGNTWPLAGNCVLLCAQT